MCLKEGWWCKGVGEDKEGEPANVGEWEKNVGDLNSSLSRCSVSNLHNSIQNSNLEDFAGTPK